MSLRLKSIIILLLASAALPLSASAFWFWNKPMTTVAPVTNVAQETTLTPAEKIQADTKYKIWAASFEKRDRKAVQANQDMFWFTIPELNYIFETETKKAKNPILTNFNLTDNNGNLNITADFQKIVKGRFSFTAQVITENKKAHLSLSKLKLYGWPLPASLLSRPLNQALDEYFTFLYSDPNYQGFTFSNLNGRLKLKPEFK